MLLVQLEESTCFAYSEAAGDELGLEQLELHDLRCNVGEFVLRSLLREWQAAWHEQQPALPPTEQEPTPTEDPGMSPKEVPALDKSTAAQMSTSSGTQSRRASFILESAIPPRADIPGTTLFVVMLVGV